VVSPHFDGHLTREEINMLWRLVAQTDNRIETMPCGERQWHDNVASAVIEIA